MMNSHIAAQHGHMFLYRGWEVKTPGNPYAHAILRGYVDKFGRNMPNYHYEDLQNLLEHYQGVNESAQTKLVNPAVIVDTNHSNSGNASQNRSVSVRMLCTAARFRRMFTNW